ncbi:MAG: hypothetical protein GW913_15490 [Myxococcales bacterium]|nr:hypothetical protein [Myxococcales bacterium]
MRVALAAPCASLALGFAALWLAVPVHAQRADGSLPLGAEASEPGAVVEAPVDAGVVEDASDAAVGQLAGVDVAESADASVAEDASVTDVIGADEDASESGEASASGDEPGEASTSESEPVDPFEWFALPLAGYSSDVGLAGILLGAFIWHAEGHEPYRDRLQILATATTKKVIYDEVRYERIGLFGRPLRLAIMARFIATPVSNYCGLGNDVSCSGDVARAAALAAGLSPDTPEYAHFVDRYYRFRVTRPELELDMRAKPWHTGLELHFGWHLAYEISGFFRQRGSYPGSLYAQDYGDGEEGMRSEAEVGLLLDTRDNERQPARGYVLDASLRGAAFFVGSAWN